MCGDVADDATLLEAGLERASALVAALDTDADNLYVTVAAKSMRPGIQIIARARNESSESKLTRAVADRVVIPKQLGGDRMASFVTQPHVVDFIDVVMHDGSLTFRLEELSPRTTPGWWARPSGQLICVTAPGPSCLPSGGPTASS